MSESSSYPRVLVVGQSFYRGSGGGVTQSNLFLGWPKDRLAAIVPGDQPSSADVCTQVYALGRAEEVWKWPLSLVPRRDTPQSGPREVTESATPAAGEPPRRSVPARMLYSTLDALGMRDAVRTIRVSEALEEWIRRFAPDIVYAQFSSVPSMDLVQQVLDIADVPLVVHFMDDWPSTVYRQGALSSLMRRTADRRLREIVGRADAAMAISDAMAGEYQARYGRSFTAVHNPVDIERWDERAREHPFALDGDDGGFNIVYAGNVGRANEQSLIEVARVVKDLSLAGRRAHLWLFVLNAGPAIDEIAAWPGVTVRQGVEYERVPGLLAAADVLLLPLNHDESGFLFARLSIPTKASEYMASGRPIVAYVPKESAVASYAREGGWAMLVDEPSPKLLGDALEALESDSGLRERIGSAARQSALGRHDATKVRETFRAQLAVAQMSRKDRGPKHRGEEGHSVERGDDG